VKSGEAAQITTYKGEAMKINTNNKNTIFSRLTDAYLALLLGAYLLYPGFGGYQEITVQKWELYMWLTGAYVVALLILRVEVVVIGAQKMPTLKEIEHYIAWPQRLLIIYLLLAAISTAFSDYLAVAFWGSGRCEGLVTILLYGLSFLLVSLYGRPKMWMLWIFAAAVSLNCILALFQLAGANPLSLYPEGMNYYDANVQYAGAFLGTIGNIDILSALLSLSIPAFWAAFLCLKDRRRFLLLPPMALSLIVLLKAFVAGGILGVFGAWLISIPILIRRKRARKFAWIAVAGTFAAVAVLVYFWGNRLGGFLYEASELMHGRWNDDFGSGRLYIWRNVLELAPDHFLLGGGPDTLGMRTDAAFERYDASLGFKIHSAVDVAHNEYLNIFINQGLLDLLPYVAFLAVSAIRWVRTARYNLTVAVCGCAVLGYCIQAFFGISSPISAPYLWMALAMLNSVNDDYENAFKQKSGGVYEKERL